MPKRVRFRKDFNSSFKDVKDSRRGIRRRPEKIRVSTTPDENSFTEPYSDYSDSSSVSDSDFDDNDVAYTNITYVDEKGELGVRSIRVNQAIISAMERKEEAYEDFVHRLIQVVEKGAYGNGGGCMSSRIGEKNKSKSKSKRIVTLVKDLRRRIRILDAELEDEGDYQEEKLKKLREKKRKDYEARIRLDRRNIDRRNIERRNIDRRNTERQIPNVRDGQFVMKRVPMFDRRYW